MKQKTKTALLLLTVFVLSTTNLACTHDSLNNADPPNKNPSLTYDISFDKEFYDLSEDQYITLFVGGYSHALDRTDRIDVKKNYADVENQPRKLIGLNVDFYTSQLENVLFTMQVSPPYLSTGAVLNVGLFYGDVDHSKDCSVSLPVHVRVLHPRHRLKKEEIYAAIHESDIVLRYKSLECSRAKEHAPEWGDKKHPIRTI